MQPYGGGGACWQDATDAVSKAKAAREEADKACKGAAARERQLQAANSTLQSLDASLKVPPPLRLY
jgi:hypothetical protein